MPTGYRSTATGHTRNAMDPAFQISESPSGVRFNVHIQPRSSRTEVAGVHGDALKIRVAAPPVEGEANAELVKFLAKQLGLPKTAVRIVKGEQSRQKVVEIAGANAGEILSLAG